MGGEIENDSQKDNNVNNYVVFPRVSMIIPAPHSRILFIFSTQMTAKLPNFRYR